MYTPCVLTVYVGIFSESSLVGSPCKVGTWIHVILHTAPYERTRRGDHLAPSPQLTIRANCLNLEQKKCKFPYDERIFIVGPTKTGRMLTVILEPKEGAGMYKPITAYDVSKTSIRAYKKEIGGEEAA